MFDRIIKVFDPEYKRYKICSECNERIYDSKWNNKCRVCWEGKPKPPTKEDMDRAMAIWGNQGNPIDYILKSGGSVEFTSSVCEVCAKQFRPWRKHTFIHDGIKWKTVCKECANENSTN